MLFVLVLSVFDYFGFDCFEPILFVDWLSELGGTTIDLMSVSSILVGALARSDDSDCYCTASGDSEWSTV